MIGIVSALVCLPLGWFVPNRLVANTTYAVAYLWAFVFQTLYLQAVPGMFPEGEFPWAYGLVTAGVFAVGFGLIEAGRRARRRRDATRNAALSDLVVTPAA